MVAWIGTFRRLGCRLGILVPGLLLSAQSQPFQVPQQKLTPAESETVEFNRKLATPRTPTPRPPLSPSEEARVNTFKRCRNSVVFIHSVTRKYVYRTPQGNVSIPPASGTGYVWDNLGHVVTNHHLITLEEPQNGLPVSEAEDLQVTLADGRSYKALVIGRNLALDIAVLHVFAPLGAMKPLPVGTSRDLVVGQDVTAIGNPFGLDHTLTAGVISALGRDILTNFNTHITGAIQTDAAINPGNSGGPLLDRAGRLVGMNTAISTSSGASSGVGFAIPVDTLNKVVPLLIAKGQTYRPTLGFATLRQNPELAAALGITEGAIAVLDVDRGGIADKAGLRGIQPRKDATAPLTVKDYVLGDLIVAINGVAMKSEIQLMDFLELTPPDEPLAFEIIREGKRITLTMKPGASPPESPAAPVQETRS